jgi:hypothetical protein
MLVHSLGSDNAQLKVATLETMELMVQDAPGLIQEHISTIVKSLTNLDGEGNNAV